MTQPKDDLAQLEEVYKVAAKRAGVYGVYAGFGIGAIFASTVLLVGMASGFLDSPSSCDQPATEQARWTPNPDRGSADSTLSGGRR